MVVFAQIAGLFLGVLSRTFLPFLRKLYKGKIKSFRKKYIYQSIGALFLSFIIFFIIFPQYPYSAETKTGGLILFKLFCIAFAFGFGFHSLINETAKWASNGKKS
ncbi:MAG: hypothetical protein B1H08_02655 [Candidatus Omnitrophica bacterium 4484_171]|nr:MAG: hypothetical protein B1H08_02655 [Candidatus Omnitrophica bacterium 4484_171]